MARQPRGITASARSCLDSRLRGNDSRCPVCKQIWLTAASATTDRRLHKFKTRSKPYGCAKKRRGIPSGGQAGAPFMSGRTRRGALLGIVSDLELAASLRLPCAGLQPRHGPYRKRASTLRTCADRSSIVRGSIAYMNKCSMEELGQGFWRSGGGGATLSAFALRFASRLTRNAATPTNHELL
jgi:hypothetical protein